MAKTLEELAADSAPQRISVDPRQNYEWARGCLDETINFARQMSIGHSGEAYVRYRECIYAAEAALSVLLDEARMTALLREADPEARPILCRRPQ